MADFDCKAFLAGELAEHLEVAAMTRATLGEAFARLVDLAVAALEVGDAPLEGHPRGVLGARIFVAGVLTRRALLEGGRRVDRLHDRARAGVGLLPGVNRAGGKRLLHMLGGHSGSIRTRASILRRG